MSKTCITHLFNEEFLLPWWIENTERYFDKIIFLDYGSTDRSAEIVRSTCKKPFEWRRSRNPSFGAIECDQEVMDVERSISGWKMALNTTEFLLCKNLDEVILSHIGQGVTARGIQMADPPEVCWTYPNHNEPLIKQRYQGFFERDHCVSGVIARERMIHAFTCGEYNPGRHSNRVPHVNDPRMMVLWYGCSPMTEELLNRRLQIQTKIPEYQRAMGMGWGHFVDRQALLEGPIGYNQYVPHIRDLKTDQLFLEAYTAQYG